MTGTNGAVQVAVDESKGSLLLRLFDANPRAGALLNAGLRTVADEAVPAARFAIAAAHSVISAGDDSASPRSSRPGFRGPAAPRRAG